MEKDSRGSLNNEKRPQEDELVAEDIDDGEERNSVFEVDTNVTSFWGRMRILWNNKCFLYLVAAGFCRFFGGYSLGFLSGPFFEKRFPDYTNQFAYMNTVVVVGGGLPASMLGGWMSDKFEHKYGSMKGLIAGVGALVSAPFIFISYTIQPGFWGSILSYYVAYFTAEMWYGPSHA